MSVREAMKLIHVSKDTVSKCFKELEAKGFIRRNVCGSFAWKLKQATTWILTEFGLGDSLPAKDFASWRPGKEKHGPNRGTECPKIGTHQINYMQAITQSVLGLGVRAPSCTVCRSQSTARI